VSEAAEPSTPHAGRMYDYVIGGTHNFQVDRIAAEQFVKLVPSVPLAAQQNRSFLKVAAEWWRRDGIDRVLDLGSGLPTRGHLNEYARVIKSDLYLRAPDELPVLLAPWEVVSSRQVQRYAREGDSLTAEPQDGGLEMHGVFAIHR